MSLDRRRIIIELKKDFNNINKYELNFIKNSFKIDYISKYESIIYIVNRILMKDNKIMKYCEKAMDTFDIDRYEKYLDWRKSNKFNSNTIDFYKLVYGDKWEEYFKNKKYSRHYEPEYIMERDKCSYEEAVNTINEMKKDKATSLEGFIKRHGETKGRIMFNNFRKTSNIFNKDNITKRHGEEKYEEIYNKYVNHVRRSSPWCKEYWENLGFFGEENKNKISEYQRKNSGVSKEAILIRCNDEQYAQYIYSKINSKKDSKSFGHCLKLTNNNFLEATLLYELKKSQSDHRSISNFKSKSEYIQYNDNISEKAYHTLLKKNLVINKELIDDFKNYCKIVSSYTKKNLNIHGVDKFGDNYKERIKLDGDHVDHIYSKFDGYINSVDPKIIGNIENLQLLNYRINTSKNKKSWLTLEQLYNKYNNSIYIKIN